MIAYEMIDKLPDLSSYDMSASYKITLENDIDKTDKWDFTGGYYSTARSGVSTKTFSWVGKEGGTYTLGASSYHAPAFAVYDFGGNAIKFAGNAIPFVNDYLAATLTDFVAPYSGTYYAVPLWDSGVINNQVSFIVFEDVDTSVSQKLTSSEMSFSTFLTFEKEDISASDNTLGIDNYAYFSTKKPEASLKEIFKWDGQKGATYAIVSKSESQNSYPVVYDKDGNQIPISDVDKSSIVTSNDGKNNTTIIKFVAPYTGTYYSDSNWSQGESSNSFVEIQVLENVANPLVIETPKIVISSKPTSNNDQLTGTNKNNKLSGLAGDDTLIGGSGSDIFQFNDIKETGKTTKTRDTITDFKTSDGDKIDLSGIDANTNRTGDQPFTNLDVGNKFSGKFASTGLLFFETSTQILWGNVDTKEGADFSIQLNGVKNLTLEDFIL